MSISFIRRLCPADSSWRPSAHQKPLSIYSEFINLVLPCWWPQGPACTPCLLEILGVGSTAPSYHALIVGGGPGAGPPFSWRGGNCLQCFSTGQLFQPCTHLKVQPCCALHMRLYTAQVKEQDVALHQGNPNGGLKAELNLFRWQSNIWWRSASWVLLRIPPNQEILRLCLLLTCQ